MNRIDVYQSVTDRIMTELEAGTVPWRKPWTGGGPISLSTSKPYRGINVFLLGIQGYSDPRWGTFKAVKEAAIAHARSEGREIVEKQNVRKATSYAVEVIDGKEVPFLGGVRKGSKATWIILWKPVKRRGVEEGEDDTYVLLKQYPVFNAEQCDGLPEHEFEHDWQPIERAEEIVREYVYGTRTLRGEIVFGPQFSIGGDTAAYDPGVDAVYMPPIGVFVTPEAYHAAAFHELIHSTGHDSRLKRLDNATFGSDPYAREELVAEMGAAMLGGIAGLSLNGQQSAAYIANWLQALRNDRKLVVQAAAQAQKGADLILGTTFEDSPNTENREEVHA